MSRKISVSLPDADVQFLDQRGRGGLLRVALGCLARRVARIREDELVEEYQSAFEEWRKTEDAELVGRHGQRWHGQPCDAVTSLGSIWIRREVENSASPPGHRGVE